MERRGEIVEQIDMEIATILLQVIAFALLGVLDVAVNDMASQVLGFAPSGSHAVDKFFNYVHKPRKQLRKVMVRGEN